MEGWDGDDDYWVDVTARSRRLSGPEKWDVSVSVDEGGRYRGTNNGAMKMCIRIPDKLVTVNDVKKHLKREFPYWPPEEE